MTAVVKCLVWDLDDTVWDGVVLERDAGEPRPEVRAALRALDDRGIVHAVASRGESGPATAHLRAHGLAELFTVLEIGWNAKSEAVRRIAETLNIGLDAIAFVDNDPVERAEVAAALPQVRCYDADEVSGLPDRPEFTPGVVTEDARRRRERYRAELDRRDTEAAFTGSDADFLASLGLVLTVRRATPADLDRAHELTVRTNQLNTTGRTFDAAELRELIDSGTHEVLVAALRDRFGSYGTVGLAVTEFRDGDSVLLLLLMSCRVMSRGVGGALLAHLIDRARTRGHRCVAEFTPTPVNRIMLVTLRFAGFSPVESPTDQVLLVHEPTATAPSTAHVLLRSPDSAVRPGDFATALLGQFTRVPDRVAVRVGDHTLTYRELDTATAALAARLTGAGVRPGRIVLCYFRQSPNTVVAMLAALRAGAAWCVIEPGHPESALRTLLDDIDCGAVIYDPAEPGTSPDEMAALFAGRRPALLAVGGQTPVADLPGPQPPGAPIYVLTTSGSTGTPKAVVVSHANVAAMLAGREYPHRDGELVTLSTWRLTADGALILSLWALTRGGTAVFPAYRELPDAAAVGALIRSAGVTHLSATPSFYRLLLPHLAVDAAPELVSIAGEAFPPPLAARHREALPEAVLLNEYGPTEATVSCLWHTVLAGTDPETVPIGTPVPGSSAYVLGPQLIRLAPGEIGDLYIGGDQITDGYAARPALTAGRYVADPFTEDPGARMYRTGDLARVDERGEIEFLGRDDAQIKIRGARVERHAVEAVIETHPAVRHAVVLDVADADGITELFAFVVPRDVSSRLDTVELTRFCAGQLVPMAVPSRFLPIDTLPIAAAGKLDEAALRARARRRAAGAAVSRAGWRERERELAELWELVLEHGEFDRDDSFFELGGNSHRVVFLHLQLEQRWPGALRVGRLFDLRTITEQAEAIDAARTGPADPPGPDHPGSTGDSALAPTGAVTTAAFEL
ncbi:amino acid adenylation domain-containing protein [Nocardia sp. NPDC057668]|uniref:amino acid adenylation domain-containing protein n=1 Tax=Nocardia sp. NPDC057668 TaxID=3346202 RepID=UPI00366BCB81